MAKISFAAWMSKVDDILIDKVGIDSSDLADIAYMDLWESGKSPSVAANKAIKANI
jgi:hypothetical protein